MFVSETTGFSLNTDIFETNIFNLAVVIGVLIYYGRPFLSNLLQNRKDLILKSLKDADNKLLEAEEVLSLAKKNFEVAKVKAYQIRNQGILLSNQTSKSLLNSVQEDIKRLTLYNISSVKFEEEKSINELCNKLGSFSLLRAVDILNDRFNSSLQKKIIYKNIDKLSLKSFFIK
jgi:F-type H+-transporting ATPase subunit b